MHHLKHLFVAAALSTCMARALADVITLDVEGVGNFANEPSTHNLMFLLDRNCTTVSASVAEDVHSISLIATDGVQHGIDASAVVPSPEPSAMPMLAAGLFAVGLAARQRRTGWHG
jgi:hypothetical protein